MVERASSPFLPSNKPAVLPTDLTPCLPDFAIEAIREALTIFGRRIKGYDMPDAILTAVETRTSSPIRIKRNKDFQSINTQGLYPAGEGAGYAGGILSSAIDGIKIAEAHSPIRHQPRIGHLVKRNDRSKGVPRGCPYSLSWVQ